ncbi:lipopolysaccharide biosynthesis protein [Bradyrhizobium guangxiense]
MSDLGFTAAVTVDVARKMGAGDMSGARTAYRSVWALSTCISIALIAGGLLLSIAIFSRSPGSSFLMGTDYALPLMLCYSAGVLQTSVVASAFRSTGDYALGTFLPDNITLIEGLCMVGAVMLGSDLTLAAATLLLIRYVGTTLLAIFLRVRIPWLGLGYRSATRSEIIRLAKPSISLILIPVGLAVSLQGTVAVVGLAISPTAAAIFSSTRTISRLAVQVVATISRASVPELSRAIGSQRLDIVALILIANLITGILLILPAGLVLSIFGKEIVMLWSSGKLVPSVTMMVVISVGMVFHACWWNAANLLTAAGLQVRFALFFLGVSVVGLGLCWFGSRNAGLVGACAALLAVEATMLVKIASVIHKSKFVDMIAAKKAAGMIAHRAYQIFRPQ